MMMLCGVDEAGRGPVMGPLVVAAVAVEDDSELKSIGVKDSKKLSPARRESLAIRINEMAVVGYKVITHEEIDARGTRLSLNQLEAAAFAELLGQIRAMDVYIDACDVVEDNFKHMVGAHLDYSPVIICEHKADDRYPVVSAASIIAKTNRDRLMAEIGKELGQDVGSGYSSDPHTIAFLQKWIKEKGDLPPYTRRSWATSKQLVSSSKTSRLTDWE